MPLQLACARIGAVHSVVFAGFSAESLADRIVGSQPNAVLTASAVNRGAKKIDLKARFPSSVRSEMITLCSLSRPFKTSIWSSPIREHVKGWNTCQRVTGATFSCCQNANIGARRDATIALMAC